MCDMTLVYYFSSFFSTFFKYLTVSRRIPIVERIKPRTEALTSPQGALSRRVSMYDPTIYPNASGPKIYPDKFIKRNNPSRHHGSLPSFSFFSFNEKRLISDIEMVIRKMCALMESNHGPFEYQSSALPTELSAHEEYYIRFSQVMQ